MLKRIVSKIISKSKGEYFELDGNISNRYIFNLGWKRALMILRGLRYFPNRFPKVHIGNNVKLHNTNAINFKGFLSLGDNTFIDALSKEGVRLGKSVSCGPNTTIVCSGTLENIGVGLEVGDFVGLGRDCFFGCAGGIKIGTNTIFGNMVTLHSENHNFLGQEPIRKQGVSRIGIKIGENCWIGAKATILDGANIEDKVIISAGSVVTKGTYKSGNIYGGVPAKFIKKIK